MQVTSSFGRGLACLLVGIALVACPAPPAVTPPPDPGPPDAAPVAIGPGPGAIPTCAEACGGRTRCARFQDALAFEAGRATLGHQTEGTLERVARWLEETPEVKEIEVRGYAADATRARRELLLATDRAVAAAKWLTAHGVADKRVVARGFANAPQDPPHVESGVEFVVTVPDQTACCAAVCR